MELMSVLLLCAFVVMLPQALGVNKVSDKEVRSNTSIVNPPHKRSRSHQILKMNAALISPNMSELQALFMGNRCKYCIKCMKQALEAHKNQNQAHEWYYDIHNEHFKIDSRPRKRRSILEKFNNTKMPVKFERSKEIMSIRKYRSKEGKIYALKVNEIEKPEQIDGNLTCTVYSVKKSLSCESGGNDLIRGGRKVHKKGRKLKLKATTTKKPMAMAAVFKKREVRVENSHMPESFMPSIEDLY